MGEITIHCLSGARITYLLRCELDSGRDEEKKTIHESSKSMNFISLPVVMVITDT